MLFCMLIFLKTIFLFAQSEWELSKEGNGIKVYTSSTDSSKFKSVKVEGIFSGTIEKLISILKNVDGNIKWVYNTRQTHTVRIVNSNEFIYYAETSLPWPLRNRDVVINMLFNKESGQSLTVKATGLQGEVENKNEIVRIPYFNGLWQATAIDSNHLTIHYILTVDPGGSIPAWAYNKFVTKGPFNTFNNLAALLKAY